MTRRHHILAPIAIAALLAACAQEAETTAAAPDAATPNAAEAAADTAGQAADLSGFTYVKGEDLFGYYMPTQEVQVGNWRLDHIHMGGPAEFAQWEGGERTDTYAPVMLEFSDVTSPKGTNELGQEYHEVTARVLPTAFKVGGGDFRFAGSHPQLGEVRVDGTYDPAELARIRSAGPGGDAAPILRTGTMIGQTPFRNLSFFWFGGD